MEVQEDSHAMSQLLVVFANPRKNSYTRRLLQAFLNEYEQQHPHDTVTELDIYQSEIPLIDAAVIEAWDKPRQECSAEELQILARIDHYTDAFIAADKVVFAAPMWNLQFPPQLMDYLATIMVAGKTFAYTEHVCKGLVADKPVAMLHVRGGVFSSGPLQAMDHATPYLRSLCRMIGISNFQSVICEGLEMAPDQAGQILDAAMQKARELAKMF
jgi:FMN-dependent NADH-azoreductase